MIPCHFQEKRRSRALIYTLFASLSALVARFDLEPKEKRFLKAAMLSCARDYWLFIIIMR